MLFQFEYRVFIYCTKADQVVVAGQYQNPFDAYRVFWSSEAFDICPSLGFGLKRENTYIIYF